MQGEFIVDIVLSWSGDSSKEAALALREWLPEVLPGCNPWMSSEDIKKGDQWAPVLHGQLAKSAVIIVCVTPDNVRSPWLYYEAGHVAARVANSAVCPYLIGVAGKLVTGSPLGQYQWSEADKSDTLKLVRSLNDRLGAPHDGKILEGNFNSKWPQLRRRLDAIVAHIGATEDEVTKTELPIIQQLSDEAKQLLIAACSGADQRATIAHVRTLGGVYIQAGGRQMAETKNARSVAVWKGALDELEGFGLVEPLSDKREIYEVTRKGWEVFDQIDQTAIGR